MNEMKMAFALARYENMLVTHLPSQVNTVEKYRALIFKKLSGFSHESLVHIHQMKEQMLEG